MTGTVTSPTGPGFPIGHESGREVVVLGFALVLTAVAIEVALGSRVGLFFDLWFVAVCLALAWLVRRDGFFTMSVLPPLLMLGTFVLTAVVARDRIAAPSDSLVQAVISGLSHHSGALAAGYVVALGSLVVRQRAEARLAHTSNRVGSPAP